MSIHVRRAALAVCLLAALAMPACRKPSPGVSGGPDAVAAAFDKAMRDNDMEAAAGLFAYDTIARGQNEDWDDIPEGQRGLITGKVKEDKARELGGMQPAYVGGAYAPGPAQVSGSRATVRIQGQSGTLMMTLVQEDGAWRILQMQ